MQEAVGTRSFQGEAARKGAEIAGGSSEWVRTVREEGGRTAVTRQWPLPAHIPAGDAQGTVAGRRAAPHVGANAHSSWRVGTTTDQQRPLSANGAHHWPTLQVERGDTGPAEGCIRAGPEEIKYWK